MKDEYFNKLRDKLEELFEKGECCDCGKRLTARSKAIVLNAFANIYHEEICKKNKNDFE